MLQQQLVLSTEQISIETSHYSIGFAHLPPGDATQTQY